MTVRIASLQPQFVRISRDTISSVIQASKEGRSKKVFDLELATTSPGTITFSDYNKITVPLCYELEVALLELERAASS